MQYEEFDKKVRDAADNHHPAYDEQAWGRMEKLLDTHMPQEKDKRRRFIFLIFLVLLFGGSMFLLRTSSPSGDAKQPIAADNPASDKNGSEIKTGVNPPESTTSLPSTRDQTFPVIDHNTSASLQPKLNKPFYTDDNLLLVHSTRGKKGLTGPVVTRLTPGNDSKPSITETIITPGTLINAQQQDVSNQNTTPVKTEDFKNNQPAVIQSLIKSDDQSQTKPGEQTVQQGQTSPVKTKSVPAKSRSFFFSVSLAPDISVAGNSKPGQMKLMAGVGLGYNFNKLTVRTGFYSGRKVYEAAPDDYHPPTDFWTFYPFMQKIDANCKVYEIPLSVSYNFKSSKKGNWFAGVGLSSYLMKEETYNYSYKYLNNGPTFTNKWTIRNENNHLFSSLTFSGGYRLDIGKSLTVMAEPYVKLPVTGVGYGKVRLNSGGVMITVGIKTFQ